MTERPVLCRINLDASHLLRVDRTARVISRSARRRGERGRESKATRGPLSDRTIMKYRLRCITGILWSWWRVKTSALPWSPAIGILRSRSRWLACKRVYMQIRLPAINQTQPGRTRGHAAFYLPVASRYASRLNATNATCTDVSLAETSVQQLQSSSPQQRTRL